MAFQDNGERKGEEKNKHYKNEIIFKAPRRNKFLYEKFFILHENNLSWPLRLGEDLPKPLSTQRLKPLLPHPD